MAIVDYRHLDGYENGYCSGCGNSESVVFWAGAKDMGFCRNCCEYILTHLLGDYIYATKPIPTHLKTHVRSTLDTLTVQIQDAVIIQAGSDLKEKKK